MAAQLRVSLHSRLYGMRAGWSIAQAQGANLMGAQYPLLPRCVHCTVHSPCAHMHGQMPVQAAMPCPIPPCVGLRPPTAPPFAR